MDDAIARLHRATKQYGTTIALDEVGLALARGQVTALLGPNGAGKTTAVHLMLGLARPNRGEAWLFGRDPRDPAARRRVGVMLQVSKVPETLRVIEHVELFSAYYASPMPPAIVLDRSGLTGLEQRPFGELSGGERQRVLFALAVCGSPDLLFLDEPTIGLDVESRRAFWREIRRLVAQGRSVLLTTHYLEEADAIADRIVVLQKGRVVADGPPAAIKERAAGRQIRCVTRLGDAELAALPGVRAVRRDNDAVCLLVSDAEDVARDLLALDRSLAGLEITRATLEDAFIALTAAPVTAAAPGEMR
ncbi:MAG: ABC transporter ATP-binding protein [Betaproteobacteria bacterium]